MIITKSRAEIEKMFKAGQLVAQVLQELKAMVEPGITTLELDNYAEHRIRSAGAIPTFKGYKGYPFSICTSVNEQVVHAFPSKRKLKEGDIISIDCGATLDGYVGDSAITVPVGKISDEAAKLLKVTEESLYRAIKMMVIGNRLSDISHAVQSYVEPFGYSVVRDFCGHGIGTAMHEEPQVPNYGLPGRGPRLREGFVLAIEPMVNMGTHKVRIEEDGWTVTTLDKKLSAHFEHTVAITADGPWILTQLVS
ncbi:MAG: type I methionyl aminopeptidase [Acidobacteriota bacterium]|nr:type I methionyl aminopeptidase [Blastocatellia bacterium]MDW8412647.1 type I methionyl aminopeptidase [Acidobacteriota bacterium]